MPEGPEIRRAADKVAAIIEKQIITNIWFAFEHLKKFEKKLSGARVLKIETQGKAMITRIATTSINGSEVKQLSIYSHNQLYGRWFCLKPGEKVDTNRSLRLSITTNKGMVQLYSASDISVLNDQQLLQHPLLTRMGPDVLGSEISKDIVFQRLNSKYFYTRQLGQILTDQGFVAGLGNYLRCELLFVCALNPKKRPIDCTNLQLEQLAEQIIKLPRQSYQYDAITNDLHTAKKLMAAGVSKEDARFYVFRREGLACYRCATDIVKIKAGQMCYVCPQCQNYQLQKP